MEHAIPRIRSAVPATRPLQPYAHQDEAVERAASVLARRAERLDPIRVEQRLPTGR